MAGGNLGDLWFQLGVKDNTSKELQKIIDKLKTGDDAANALLRALQGFGTKKSGFKEQAEKAKEFADVLNEINRRITKLKKNDKGDEAKDLQLAVKNALSYLDMLQRINIERSKISELRSLNPNVDTSKLREAELMLENINNQLFRLQNKAQGGGGGGIDSAKVLQDYAKVLQMTFRDVKQITDQFKKENPLSAFSGGAAKVEADIARVTEKLARMRDLMAEGALRGYNTNMLGGSITELDKILARLQAASGNKSILTDAAQMKNLLSDVAVEMTKAAAATQAYGREKGKVIAQEREFAAASKLSAKDNEAELKALSDYAKRYMALQEAKRKAEKQASDERKRQSAAEARRIEADTERMSRLYAKMSLIIGRGERAGMRGLELGVNTSALERALSEATELKKRIEDANVALMGKGGRPSYSSYAEEVNKLSSSLANATQAQRELNSAQDKANRKAEAQATRDAAKAKREDAAAERQRQREIEISTRRMERLDDVLVRLRKEYGNSVKLQVDTTQIETKIKDIENQFNYLKSILQRLGSRDSTALGLITNIGDQREVQLANRVANAQREANREAQRGIELEQKRQQEIAQSAAKARNDLAAAFAGANAEAKKMQSIVGDIKSLFLQGGIVFGAQQFFNSIVQTGGEIVQQHVALRSILGDVQKADELFAQTQQLALQSPFKFGELNRDVKQLAAFGVEANDLYDTTKRLADIASGLGVDFGRLGLAFGQVKARSWLDGKELRQFAYAGLPLLQKITELYNSEGKNGRKNYTQADVKKMISGRQVSFEDVQKVLWKMTDEGGQFYNMQLVLSETLLGRWNKLIDAWDIMLGKFAEGKNVIGGTFSFIINRVTDLVLALDKLSPAMLSFGAIFAARKLGLMASGKLGLGSLNRNYAQQMNAQLKIYAIEQQQLVTEGKITQQKALQNVQARAYLLSDTTSRANAMSRLALEGKMSVLQMQKAVKEGLVTKELIRQLAVMGQITARQEQIILGGTRFAAVMNMGIAKIGGGIKSLFTMLGGWWGLAIGLAVQTFSSYSSDMDRISENAKGLRDSAYNKKKGYEDELANEKPTNSADLQQRVNSMKELLRNSGDYTQTIEDQIARAKNLNEQYDILNKGIVAARDNSQQEANDADVVAGALGASGGWGSGNPFADTLEDAVESLNEAVIKYQTLLSGLDEETKSRMDSIANQFLKPEERTMSLDEKIRILAERGGANWDSFVLKSSNGSNDIANSIYKIGIRANKVSDQINEIAKKNIPRIISFLKKSFNLFGVDFSKWCNRNSSRFASMIEKMLDACKVNVPQIREYLKSIFYQVAGAKQPKKAGGGKVEKPKTPMQQRVRRNLSKKGKSRAKVEAQATMLDSYLDETSDYNTDNNLQTELQNRYNEYKNRENKFKRGKISKALRDEAWESYNSLNQAAWEGLGYKFYPQDKKSNKVPKGKNGRSGRKEDTELKRLQERLSSLKSARQMYQKYKSIMPDEEAKKKTYNLFPEVAGLNLDDYQKAVHSLLEGFSINTTERKKFQTSICREVAEWLFDEKDKKEYERKAADFSELLNRLSSQWDLYKELFSKTGNKNFSSAAFSNPGYIDDKAKELIVEYNNKFGKDFQRENAMSMSDGVAKETLKGPGEYEAWKKIVDLLPSNYIKILQDAADIIEKTEDYEDKILKIRERYNELISKTNDPGIKARYEIQRDKEIGQVKLDKFKNSSDYLNFYGAIVSLGMDKAQAIGARIRQNINEALQSGAIDAREYAKEIKQLDEQLSKLEKLRPSFLNGGLEGIVNAKKERANDMITLGSSQYNKAKEDLNKAKINGDLEGMVAAASSKAAGEKMMEGGEKLLKGASKMSSTISMIDTIIHGINDIVQGANDTFQDIKSTASALGIDTESDGWTDANSFFEGFSSSSASATKAWESLKSGNVGGVVSGVVGSFTGWIKAFSAGHDAKLDRQIKLAERQLNELKNLSSNINSVIEKTLGGIYSYDRSSDTANKLKDVKNDYKAWDAFSKTDIGKNFFGGHNFSHYSKETYDAVMKSETNPSAYADQLALLHAQEDELRKQRQAEDDKKKTDKDKLADYDQQIKEMQLQIKTFAQDFLKDVYSIDMKSWASTLTDTIVSAWAKGEDAVDAYKKKVKDMVRDVVKNIITQKIMEKALEKPLEWLTSVLDKKGQLDETDMINFAKQVNEIGDKVVPQITGLVDALKNEGLDMRENGSSSATNSIKSITEDTADLLASYVNSIRLDLSVVREMQGKFLPEMSEIAKSQLTQLNLIAQNTLRNADAAERIDRTVSELNDNFNRVINGTKSLKMK